MYVLGVDIGSTSSKAVLLKDGQEVAADAVVQSGTGTSGPERVMDMIFKKSGLKRSDIRRIVATGYGRFTFDAADRQVSEISAHAKGIHYLFPKARTILDIGGQDVKAIAIGENGSVQNFFMNDKCAAGTGRFLEVMAGILELDVSEMAEWDIKAKHPVSVSSTCTVFAESEVISLLSQKKAKEDIIRGVHESVVGRSMGLLMRTPMEADFVMTGGVARNAGVVDALKRELNKMVYVAQNPQVTGALGAALFAWQDLEKKKGNQKTKKEGQ
ncbi:acyl-CoA dehydratase activase [Pseudoramibacter faecis]|uniref:acyl-CoA dehydratase activase n=1 Tax=Pseudoramibacter faecis TaxID=3108534 RepID=UPI002E75FFE1|nr:acyl-CoA dehydratase activase [Pseudoramibacter sp. HA2172]